LVEQHADALPEAIAGAFWRLSEQRLELGEGHLDRGFMSGEWGGSRKS
jgi:hypothetical protein